MERDFDGTASGGDGGGDQLVPDETGSEPEGARNLVGDGRKAELEFIAAAGEGILEDRLALLGQWAEPSDREFSLRLLRHYATHRQYHDTDVVTPHADTAA